VYNTLSNAANAGSSIPVKFNLGGDMGLNIFKPGYPKAKPISCTSTSQTGTSIEQTITAGGSGLSYDPVSGQYTYVWKTSKAWSGLCFTFDLVLIDNTDHTFNVQFK
jgi:hypothetical protein